MSPPAVDTLQEQLDAAISRGDATEISTLGHQLAQAQDEAALAERAQQLVTDTTAKVIRRQADEKRAALMVRARAAVETTLKSSECPKAVFTFGPVEVVVSYRTADPSLMLASAAAAHEVARTLQTAWAGRLASIRSSVLNGKKPLKFDAAGIKVALLNAADYARRQGLVTVEVRTKR